ncbi:uncharacterized protein METZ01_LOCUS122175 [marine metagenome]|uniref:Uncharacterized protein n=1 Tax=marine metagenome TaxID=408172 RepID=A0A381XY23_9ZZZZ
MESAVHREFETEKRKLSKSYPIDYFYIDIAEVGTEKEKLCPFTVIDSTWKFTCSELDKRKARAITTDFLSRPIPEIPYRMSAISTYCGLQFTNR